MYKYFRTQHTQKGLLLLWQPLQKKKKLNIYIRSNHEQTNPKWDLFKSTPQGCQQRMTNQCTMGVG